MLNANEPIERQRYSLAHELWHIIDHPHRRWLYPTGDRELAEQLADQFAAFLLMPKIHIETRILSGDSLPQMARCFGVSELAMQGRLRELGYAEPTQCAWRCLTADSETAELGAAS